MNNHTFIFAKINPKNEYFNKVKEAIKKMIPQTLNESGCLKFILHEDENKTLYLYEEWVDEHALHYHHEMEYTLTLFENYKNWLATPIEVNKVIKID